MQISGTFHQLALLPSDDTDDGPVFWLKALDQETSILVTLTTSDRAIVHDLIDAAISRATVHITGTWVRLYTFSAQAGGYALNRPEIVVETIQILPAPAPTTTQGEDETTRSGL